MFVFLNFSAKLQEFEAALSSFEKALDMAHLQGKYMHIHEH